MLACVFSCSVAIRVQPKCRNIAMRTGLKLVSAGSVRKKYGNLSLLDSSLERAENENCRIEMNYYERASQLQSNEVLSLIKKSQWYTTDYRWIPFIIIQYHWSIQRYFSRTQWYGNLKYHSIPLNGTKNPKYHSKKKHSDTIQIPLAIIHIGPLKYH